MWTIAVRKGKKELENLTPAMKSFHCGGAHNSQSPFLGQDKIHGHSLPQGGENVKFSCGIVLFWKKKNQKYG